MLEIKYSTKQIDVLLGFNQKVEQALYRATRRAINDVGRKVRTSAVKEVSRHKNLMRKVVRKNIRLSKANQRYLSKLEASVWPTQKGMQAYGYPKKITFVKALQRFGSTKKVVRRKGVKIKVKTAWKTVQGGFVAQTKSGHRGIFKKRERESRLPSDEVYSSSIAELFETVKPAIEREARKDMNRIFDHHIGYYKNKFNL